MATITILAGPDGPLTSLSVPLRKGMPERSFYGLPDFMAGLTNDLPRWETGRLNAAQTPKQQMDAILHKWITGREIRYERMFNDLMPAKDEVWELKTPDLRIFGWIYRPRVFVAAFLDYADWYKKPTLIRSYEVALERVKTARNNLDLDEPKFTGGDFHALV